MPSSFLKHFVSLLRKYFLVVLFVLYTSLTLDGTSLLTFFFHILVVKQVSSHNFFFPYYVLYNKQVLHCNKISL